MEMGLSLNQNILRTLLKTLVMKKVTFLSVMVLLFVSFSAFADDNAFSEPQATNSLVIEQIRPSFNGITIKFNCPEDQTVFLNMVDAQGQVVITKSIDAVKGMNTELVEMDVQQLNFLVIMLNNSTEQASKRLISNGEYAVVN